MLNAITVDVEEYFHAANLAPVAGTNKWRSLPSRVVESTAQVLRVFEKRGVKGTFFILGYSARRYPQMVKDIVAAGHEIASHGYGHRIAYEQTPKQFKRDVRIAKDILEDLSGRQVIGYRAPNFSITDKNPWGHEVLAEVGYRYDSSRYPVWHPRYANQQQSLVPEKIETPSGNLVCFPLAVATMQFGKKEIRIPVAGGAYWRIFPRRFNKMGLKQVNRRGDWFTTYLHPWELETEQPHFAELPFLTKVRHYGGVKRFPNTIDYFLRSFSFSTILTCAEAQLDTELKAIIGL